jgi:hypothetical protein
MRGNAQLSLDVGQANELKLAFRRYDWSNTEIKKLCESDILGHALNILRGDAEVIYPKRLIDLTATPTLDDGHSIVKHLRQGKKYWHDLRFVLIDPYALQYVDSNIKWVRRKDTQTLTGLNRETMMPRFLKHQLPANICLRNFLLQHQHLIPQEWWFRANSILFWGTICRTERCIYVPGMTVSFGKWVTYDRRIDKDEDMYYAYDNPCVVFAPAMSS